MYHNYVPAPRQIRNMREAMFIKKNADKWTTYQHTPAATPDETADRFITLIDDLSYAKTFYPKSKVTRWINGITATIYQDIYRNKREKFSRIFEFWKYELPLLFRKYHTVFLFSTVAFLLFTFVGVYASINDPAFLSGILGENYVRTTEENIAKGDPFGIYKDDSPFNTFVFIAVHNIRIAFTMFLGGLTLGLWTLYNLWTTGLMVGSFHQFFFARGFGAESILVIWIHGVLELASIVIASTAGFILARGILITGTYSRVESFKRGVRDASKVMIALVPFFIMAAFMESYVTHLMSQTIDKQANGGMPLWLAVLVLIASLVIIAGYFIVWPVILEKRGFYTKKDSIVSRLLDTHE